MWYVPADEDAEVALDMAWQRLTGMLSGEPCEIAVKGRVIRVPEAAKGVARFSFGQLCGQPLGASDYLRIAHEFHTLILDRIPVMDYPQRNEAKRFIALIDTLYDNAVKLVASAEAEPPALYLATDGYEANEFKRTASRLIEMRSNEYLALPHGRTSAAHRARPRESWRPERRLIGRRDHVASDPRGDMMQPARTASPACALLRRSDEFRLGRRPKHLA